MPLPFGWSGVSGVEFGVLDTAPVIMMGLPETLSSGRRAEMDGCVIVPDGGC